MGQSGSELMPAWRPSSPRRLQAIRERMARLAYRLAASYGTPDLGNLADPLDEAVFILLTYQTDLDRARAVWSQLKTRFPTWDALAAAPAFELADVLRPSGFQVARARLIRTLLEAVKQRFGRLSLEPLRAMSDLDAEQALRALPGFDLKGARCVLLYSFGRHVFPVDSNTFRFMKRYGVLSTSSRYRRRSTHDDLQQLVPPACRYTLHVNLVVHGQQTCTPAAPKCPNCPLRRRCATGRKFT